MFRQITRGMCVSTCVSACFLSAVTTVAARAAETVTYTYDVFGRLTNAQVSGGVRGGVQHSFGYDPTDNRSQVQVSGSSSSGSITLSALGGVGNQTSAGVVLGVHISGSGSLTGMVTFSENDVFLGSAFVSQGEASVMLEGFALGTHTIVATYSGDATNAPYSYAFTIKVQSLSWLPSVLQLLLQ